MARASRARKRMIRPKRKQRSRRRRRPTARNRGRTGSAKFSAVLREAQKHTMGREALKRFRRFWGVSTPSKIEVLERDRGGRMRFLVGMGWAPVAVIADRPNRRGKPEPKARKHRGRYIVATDAKGRRIYLIRNRRGPIGKNLKHVGYAAETHYIPSTGIEKMGSFKRGKHWVHKHSDEGGRYPKVYRDSSGNYIYGPGTYSVGRWIRR